MVQPLLPTIEERIHAIASRQHGVVGRSQLLEAGIPKGTVDKRVRSKRLRMLHRGVYLLGSLAGPLEPAKAREAAAVLACGPGAVLSHESAAALWEILPSRAAQGSVHVTVPGGDRGRKRGICPHRVHSLPTEDQTLLDGVPLTTAARTLIDLASKITPRALEQAMATAVREGLAELEEVLGILERGPRRKGVSRIKQLAAEKAGPTFIRSVAEEKLLGLAAKGGLPAPKANAWLEGMEVDFLWTSERVVVEVDGYAFHKSRQPFENDRRRDARLTALGFRVLRVTWRQLSKEPHVVLVRLAQILAHGRASPQ